MSELDDVRRPQDDSGPVPDTEIAEWLATVTRAVARADGELDPQTVVRIAARAVPHADHAAITIVRTGRAPVTTASTGELPERVDALQYSTGEGPCLEAIEQADLTHADDLRTDTQWPRFAAQAVMQTSVRSMFGVRIPVEERYRGGLNFYAERPGAFTSTDLAVGSVLASLATVALQRDEARRQVGNLELALNSSRVIGSAMGILMARRYLTRDQAFAQLQRASQHLHRKLRDIAEEVTETGELPAR